jgi:hypothetical protein
MDAVASRLQVLSRCFLAAVFEKAELNQAFGGGAYKEYRRRVAVQF